MTGLARAAGQSNLLLGQWKRGDQLVHETLVPVAIVTCAFRPRAQSALPICLADCCEGAFEIAGLLQCGPECKAESRAVGRGEIGACECGANALHDGVVCARGGRQRRQPGQRRVACGIDVKDALIERRSLVLVAEVFVQVGQVEQRRHVTRIERERRVQLGLGRIVLPQEVGVDDAPVEVRFLGMRYAAIEGLLIRSERRVELAEPAQQDRKIEPGVGKIGKSLQQALISGGGFVEATGPFQFDSRASQSLQFVVRGQRFGSMAAMVVRAANRRQKKAAAPCEAAACFD